MIDYLNYGALAADISYGRFPDGGDQRVFDVGAPAGPPTRRRRRR